MINSDPRVQRWQEKSPHCVKNFNETRWGLELTHLIGVITTVASIASILFLYSSPLYSIGFVFQVTVLPLGAVIGGGLAVMPLFVRSVGDWHDYTHIETCKKIKQFWCNKSSLKEFATEIGNEINYIHTKTSVLQLPIIHLRQYGLVSKEKIVKVYDFAKNFYNNNINKQISVEERNLNQLKIEMGWEKAFKDFKEDFPDFESMENSNKPLTDLQPKFFIEKFIGHINPNLQYRFKIT